MHRSKTASLFDHLVSARDERGWYVEAERARGLEIDDELEGGRLLDRQIAGLLALEDAVDVGGRPPELVVLTEAVGKQPTLIREHAQRIDRRQAMTRGECNDLRTVHRREGIEGNDNPAAALACELLDCGFDLLAAPHRAVDERNADRRGVPLDAVDNLVGSGAQELEASCQSEAHIGMVGNMTYEVGFGSFASFRARSHFGRFTPDTRRDAQVPHGPESARRLGNQIGIVPFLFSSTPASARTRRTAAPSRARFGSWGSPRGPAGAPGAPPPRAPPRARLRSHAPAL